MTGASSKLADRIRSSIVASRMQECVRCCECGNAITPWETCCPSCGQADPSRMSSSVGVYLVLGFLFLASAISALFIAF
jgi:hypothetical protein